MGKQFRAKYFCILLPLRATGRKMGRFFPCVNRSTNSVASSHMVTSAVNSVSQQWANPSCLSAVSILPVVTVPVGSPKASPNAYRTDGAGMAMHLISESHNFRRNSGIQICSSKMAPSRAVRQALPAIDATFRVADFMRFKRFPKNGSSRAVGLADIASNAFLFVDIDEK